MLQEKKSFDFKVSKKAEKIGTIIAIVYCAFEIAYSLGLLRTRLLLVYPGSFRSLVLAIILVSTFILRPAKRGTQKNKIPWWDYLLVAASLPGPIYMAWAYVELIPIHPYFATPFEQVLGVISCLGGHEAHCWLEYLHTGAYFRLLCNVRKLSTGFSADKRHHFRRTHS